MSTRVLISMPTIFLEKIDKLADAEARTRSELVREALRFYLKKHYLEVEFIGGE